MAWIVLLTEGDDLPEAFGPFRDAEDCAAFTETLQPAQEWVAIQVKPPVEAWR